MTPAIRVAALALAALAIAGCAAGSGPRTPRKVIDRVLREAPYAAQPSLIVAREIEFARAAREDGQWTAFRAFATDDALLHGRNGPVLAKPVLGTLDDPEKAVQWVPRVVMMSCDGKTAVSQGRFLDPEGNVGTFVTVWERDGYSDDYKWSYDVGANDDPQPPRKDAEEGVLVVTAYDKRPGANAVSAAVAVEPEVLHLVILLLEVIRLVVVVHLRRPLDEPCEATGRGVLLRGSCVRHRQVCERFLLGLRQRTKHCQ